MRVLAVATLLSAPLALLAAPAKIVVLDVQNMTCALCKITVEQALAKVPGVVPATINLGSKTATVQFDPDQADVAILIKATTRADYPATAER
ncbi:MAG: heavy metal-associated domain-containing protein [Casimicrobiaceae bacterium]